MNKVYSRRLTFTLCSLLFTLYSAMAQVLTPAEALSKALSVPTVKRAKAIAGNKPSYQLAKTYEADGQPAVYLYLPTQGQGFLMATAEASPAAQTVLGYSDEGEYTSDSLPEALEYQARMFACGVAQLRTMPVVSDAPARAKRLSIAPIVKTAWGQDSPFNLACPTGQKTGSPVNNHYYVGCVATAMAQIMKAHNWPKTARGYHEYNNPVGEGKLSYDYEGHTFDWERMNNGYSRWAIYYGAQRTASDDAVADLSYATSVAVNMGFSSTGSGTETKYVAPALVNNFCYDSSIHLAERKYYTLQAWEDLIYNQLQQKQPVFYACTVHAYLCDGYQGDGLFHMNFGWYGQSDGYYALSAIIPGATGEIVQKPNSSWLTDHVVVYNIKPETTEPRYTERITGEYFSFTKTDSHTYRIGGEFRAYALEMAPAISGNLGVSLERIISDGVYDEPQYVEAFDFNNAAYRAKITDSYSVDLSAITDGTYRVRPAHRDSYGDWHPVQLVSTATQYALLAVSNGEGTLLPLPAVYPVAQIYRWPQALYNYTGNQDAMREIQVSITATDKENEYSGHCKLAVVDADGNQVAYSDGFDNFTVAPGKQIKLKLNHAYSTYVGAQGNYFLRVVLCNAWGDVTAWISDPVPVWFGRKGAVGDPGDGWNDATLPDAPNTGDDEDPNTGDDDDPNEGDIQVTKGDIVVFDAKHILDGYFLRSAYATDKYMTYDGDRVNASALQTEHNQTKQVWVIEPDPAAEGKYFLVQNGKKLCFERAMATDYIYMETDPAANYYDYYSFYIIDAGTDADGNHRYVFDAGSSNFPGTATAAIGCNNATKGGDLRPVRSTASTANAYWYLEAAVSSGTPDAIVNAHHATNAPAYNLQGQRVARTYRGIVIKNGKKMINNK